MGTLTRWLVLGALPLIGVLYAGSLAVWPAPPAELLATPTTSRAACIQPPVFTTGYRRDKDAVIIQGQGFRLEGESWLQVDVCRAGTLNITAQGELGGDELPQLTVTLNSAIIAAPRFDRERTVAIRIPQPGRVYLAYFNDYYRADVRVATLRDVQLTAPACQGFKSVDVPSQSAGTWNAVSRSATLVRAMPTTLIPCAAGTLTLQLQGREGNGAFPDLSFEQGGAVLRIFKTTLNWQAVELALTAKPLRVTVTNPYGKTLANRNIDVHRIEFIADNESR